MEKERIINMFGLNLSKASNNIIKKNDLVVYDGKGMDLRPMNNKKILVPNYSTLIYLGKKNNKHYLSYNNKNFWVDSVFFKSYIRKK